MPEWHDNTKPSHLGTYSLGTKGLMCYFPIESADYLTVKPYIALVLRIGLDGVITSQIYEQWMPCEDK